MAATKDGIRCGSCKGRHSSVAEVAECFGTGRGGSRPSTERQRNYAQMLFRERVPLDWQKDISREQAEHDINDMDFFDISEYIEKMKQQPNKPKEVKLQVVREAVPDGIYRRPDGTIYKVQIAYHGSGKPYAKRLVLFEDWTYEKYGTKKGEFVYDRAGLNHCTPENRLSLEEAKEFGKLYGFCIKCGIILTKEESIDAGIGPICGAKGWEY